MCTQLHPRVEIGIHIDNTVGVSQYIRSSRERLRLLSEQWYTEKVDAVREPRFVGKNGERFSDAFGMGNSSSE